MVTISITAEAHAGHCQSKFYTACMRLWAGQSSTVFAEESPTRAAGFGTKNGLYLFALTVPLRCLRQRVRDHCWELDALDPTVIADLIRAELESLIDAAAWNSVKAEEDANRAVLADASQNWALVQTFLRERQAP